MGRDRGLGVGAVVSTCGECRYKNGAHTAWCSKNKRHPTPPPTPYQEDKRHRKERPDDGRTPGTKKPRKK